MSKNYYEVLGVGKTATQDEIKKAYRELCKKYHPDRTGGDDSKIKEINEAYEVIGDEAKRKQYDISQGFGSAKFDWNTWNDFKWNSKPFASDNHISVSISLEDAYSGCKHDVLVNGRLYSVDIPRGVTNGKVLKIPGLGKKGINTKGEDAVGDLIVTVFVKNSDKYNLSTMMNGNVMLEIMCGVDWLDAILGGETTVKVFDRDVTVRIPKFTQNGGYTMVGNQGFPKFNSDELGPLRVNFIIRMPRKLNDSQMEHLRKIKESL